MRYPRDLGQHFITSGQAVQLFMSAVEQVKGLDFLEIGPGRGELTFPLAKVAGRLVAVEVDGRLATRLAKRLPANVSVVHGSGELLVLSTKTPVVISDTPFYLSSKIITNAAKNNNIRYLILGVQLEVARRVAASPGSSCYGRLSVISQVYFKVSVVGEMPSAWFVPRPKVSGAVIFMERVRPWNSIGASLERLTACLFSQRNKRAAKVLRGCVGGPVPPSLEPPAGARVKDLDPQFLLRIAEWLTEKGSSQ